jgi:hypothetical protein
MIMVATLSSVYTLKYERRKTLTLGKSIIIIGGLPLFVTGAVSIFYRLIQ